MFSMIMARSCGVNGGLIAPLELLIELFILRVCVFVIATLYLTRGEGLNGYPMSTSAAAAASQTAPSSSIVGKNQDATCYVGNLEERVTDSMIWELFLQVAPVVSIHIPRDRLNQTHYGYGFIELQSEADADYASKTLHGIKLYGRPLKVNKASADRKNLDVGANLFVGNLDPMVDDSMMMDTFKSFGNVLSAKIAREGEGGMGPSRGFAFVSFDSFEGADAAIEAMSGQFLCNRPITVSYAFKKDGKGERHGTAAERLLAAQAKKSAGPAGVNPISPTLPSTGISGYRPSTGYPQIPVSMPPAPFMMPQVASAGFDPNYAAMPTQAQMEYYAQQYAQYMQQHYQYPPPPPQ